MDCYEPSPELSRVVLSEITASLPFFARGAVKFIPSALKERAVAGALSQVLPLAFDTIALTQSDGARIALTNCGDLEEKVKGGFLKRIALWFIPSEVTEITFALHKEVLRLVQAQFTRTSWGLEIEKNEVVLVVLDTSLLKESADTVADLFLDSFDSLRAIKEKITDRFTKK